MIPTLVEASAALQRAFIQAREAGADDVASLVRLAQLDISAAIVAAVPDRSEQEGSVVS